MLIDWHPQLFSHVRGIFVVASVHLLLFLFAFSFIMFIAEISRKEGTTVADAAISRDKEENNFRNGQDKKGVIVECLGKE